MGYPVVPVCDALGSGLINAYWSQLGQRHTQ